MRIRLAILLAFAALTTLASCDKKDDVVPEPVKVNKIAVFEVFAYKDYSNSYYADYEATIHLRVYRGDKVTMEKQIVYDSTFTKLLKDLPLEMNKLVVRKVIPAVDTKKEYVSLGTGFRVGSEAYGSYEPVPDDENMPTTEIVL